MQYLPELPGSGIAADYGDTVQVENASGAAIPVTIDQTKYFQFRVDNLDKVQRHPDMVCSIMHCVYYRILDAAGNAPVVILEELEAYHNKRAKADFVKGRFAYGGGIPS